MLAVIFLVVAARLYKKNENKMLAETFEKVGTFLLIGCTVALLVAFMAYGYYGAQYDSSLVAIEISRTIECSFPGDLATGAVNEDAISAAEAAEYASSMRVYVGWLIAVLVAL